MIGLLKWLVELWTARRSGQRKMRVENHDKYLNVFHEFTRLFDRVQWDGKIDQGDLLRFRGGTYEARWLFGREIPAYAEEVFSHGRRFWLTREQLKEMGMPPDERAKLAEAHAAEEAWLFSQYKVAENKFRKYLILNK